MVTNLSLQFYGKKREAKAAHKAAEDLKKMLRSWIDSSSVNQLYSQGGTII